MALFYKHKGRLYVHLPSHQKGWFKRKKKEREEKGKSGAGNQEG